MTDDGHTVRAGNVRVWRDACLRGTGFPVRLLSATGAGTAARLLDDALEIERRGGKRVIGPQPAIEAAYQEDARRVNGVLRELAGDVLFREALLWQNREAVHGTIEAFLRRPAGGTDSKTREYERLVASYLQRYCAKNDTIGFFGPVGWATLDASSRGSRVTPGPALVDRRTVYFEHWAIDALAAQLSIDRTLRASIAPRRMPTVRLEGEALHYGIDRVAALDVPTARLIAACDGARSAATIASELGADGSLGLTTPDQVFDLLDELVESKIVIWRLEVPTCGFHPEAELRTALQALEPSVLRAEAEAALDELEAALRTVAAAAGDPAALDAAIPLLEQTYLRVSDHAAMRGAGQTYAGRKIFFEDCHRDLEVVLGADVLERIGPQLELIQISARWLSYTIAQRFRAVFTAVFRELAADGPGGAVDFVRFYAALRPHLSGDASAISPTVAAVRTEMQRKWAEVLALPGGERRVALSAADLLVRAKAVFAAPSPGWPAARHNSPDLMIAAAGPDALSRGEFTVILGEVHTGLNTVTLPTLAKEHPHPERLHEARFADIGPTVSIVEPRGSVRRASNYSLAAGDVAVEYGDARSHRPRSQVFDVAGFVVAEQDDRLVVRRRDGSHPTDVIAFLEGDLLAEAYGFDVLEPAPHRPRVEIDGFVLLRERWRFDGASVPFAKLAKPYERFVAVHRWAAEHGMPRWVFAKSSEEPKPMYCDLASPVYVEILCKLLRGGGTVSITEMLPTWDDLWLVDARGDRYCGELRMCLVDDVPWSPDVRLDRLH